MGGKQGWVILEFDIIVNPIETIVAFMRRAIAFISGPWAHICDELHKATLHMHSRNFFVLSPLSVENRRSHSKLRPTNNDTGSRRQYKLQVDQAVVVKISAKYLKCTLGVT